MYNCNPSPKQVHDLFQLPLIQAVTRTAYYIPIVVKGCELG